MGGEGESESKGSEHIDMKESRGDGGVWMQGVLVKSSKMEKLVKREAPSQEGQDFNPSLHHPIVQHSTAAGWEDTKLVCRVDWDKRRDPRKICYHFGGQPLATPVWPFAERMERSRIKKSAWIHLRICSNCLLTYNNDNNNNLTRVRV